MRKIYLKIAIQGFTVGVIMNEGVKNVLLEPLKATVPAAIKNGNYQTAMLAGFRLFVLIVFLTLARIIVLWAFERVRLFRLLTDEIFEVEGSYIETVYINDKIESIGITHITFRNGELTTDSELHWPQMNGDEIMLTVIARTCSARDLCTTDGELLHYVFHDYYLKHDDFSKTGYTKLHLFRDHNPTRSWSRLFSRPSITSYVGEFKAIEKDIFGRIEGKKLSGQSWSDANNGDDAVRNQLLVNEVKRILGKGTKLYRKQPGTV